MKLRIKSQNKGSLMCWFLNLICSKRFRLWAAQWIKYPKVISEGYIDGHKYQYNCIALAHAAAAHLITDCGIGVEIKGKHGKFALQSQWPWSFPWIRSARRWGPFITLGHSCFTFTLNQKIRIAMVWMLTQMLIPIDTDYSLWSCRLMRVVSLHCWWCPPCTSASAYVVTTASPGVTHPPGKIPTSD